MRGGAGATAARAIQELGPASVELSCSSTLKHCQYLLLPMHAAAVHFVWRSLLHFCRGPGADESGADESTPNQCQLLPAASLCWCWLEPQRWCWCFCAGTTVRAFMAVFHSRVVCIACSAAYYSKPPTERRTAVPALVGARTLARRCQIDCSPLQPVPSVHRHRRALYFQRLRRCARALRDVAGPRCPAAAARDDAARFVERAATAGSLADLQASGDLAAAWTLNATQDMQSRRMAGTRARLGLSSACLCGARPPL